MLTCLKLVRLSQVYSVTRCGSETLLFHRTAQPIHVQQRNLSKYGCFHVYIVFYFWGLPWNVLIDWILLRHFSLSVWTQTAVYLQNFWSKAGEALSESGGEFLEMCKHNKKKTFLRFLAMLKLPWTDLWLKHTCKMLYSAGVEGFNGSRCGFVLLF